MRAKKSKTCFSLEDSLVDTDHHSSHSAAAALIGSNHDLLTEILLCLPVVSICRFKCVSKHLRTLLSDTRFTLRYDTQHFRNSPLGLFINTNGLLLCEPPFRNFDYLSDPNGIKIWQSCNGLLLCSSYYGDLYTRKYYVFNPTTRQFVIIPVPGGQADRENIHFMGLAFDQTASVHYKVVCILMLDDKPVWEEEELFQIQTYSSVTREWKISIESFSARHLKYAGGVYLNGALHWAHVDQSYMYFKIDVEQLLLLPLPVETMPFKLLTRYLGESRGHLHLTVYDACTYNLLPMKVYEMLRDNSGWFVKYRVEPDGLKELRVQTSLKGLAVFDVIRGENDEDTFMVLLINGLYITYNIHDKSFKPIVMLNDLYKKASPLFTTFHCYSHTIASFQETIQYVYIIRC